MSMYKGVCAVVGCGPGMGGSVALKFAREGYKIAAFNRSAKSFGPTKASLEKISAKFKFYPCDATSQSSVRRSFAAAAADLGVINVLVYNAGGGGFGKTVMEIDPKEFIQSFNISCVGALNCVQAVIPGMLKSKGFGEFSVPKKGTILFSSATSAFRGGARTAQFACGKHALRALSQSIAKEYGKQGIHAAHVRLDCVLDSPAARQQHAGSPTLLRYASTADIAETYFALHQQSPRGWTNEIDIRPFQEGWTC